MTQKELYIEITDETANGKFQLTVAELKQCLHNDKLKYFTYLFNT